MEANDTKPLKDASQPELQICGGAEVLSLRRRMAIGENITSRIFIESNLPWRLLNLAHNAHK